jgi:hypothetical protein
MDGLGISTWAADGGELIYHRHLIFGHNDAAWLRSIVFRPAEYIVAAPTKDNPPRSIPENRVYA